MSKKTFLISLGALAVVALSPLLTHAQAASATTLPTSFQIFPAACNCPGMAPAWGCVLATIQNLMTFAVALATMVITIFIALAGFSYMTSGGNPEGRQLANKRLTNAVIGLLIVLCAYLLVDSIMKVIYNPNAAGFGPWNSILGSNPGADCLQPRALPTALPAMFGAGAAANPTGGTASAGSPTVGASGINIAAAVAHLDSAAVPTPGNGQCAEWVREALDAGGFNDSGHPTNAKDYGPFLTSKGLSDIGGSDGSPQAGDIVVIQNYPGGSVPGHIAMFDGSSWVSDFVQQDFWGGPGYRSYQPAHEFYRP